MKRLLLVPALLLCCSGSESDLGPRLARFHAHYNPFSRHFLGCPPAAREMDECDPRNGWIDYQEYSKARKAAMELFELEEKK